MIDAIIFDFDGTIGDTMQIWKQTDAIFFARRGIDYHSLAISFQGMSMTEAARMVKERFQFKESIEEIRAEWIAITEGFYKKEARPKPYAKRFIMRAKESGYTLAVATSNAKELILPLFERWGLKDCFDYVLTSCEAGKGKPSPDVYVAVAEFLGLVPAKCLVFEDTLEGVVAAKDAGMQVYCVRDEASRKDEALLRILSDKYIEGFCYFFEKDDLLNFKL